MAPGRRLFKSRRERVRHIGIRPTMQREVLPAHFEALEVPYRVTDSNRVTASDVKVADVVIATWWETVEWVIGYPNDRGVKVHLAQDHEMFTGQPLDRVRATYVYPVIRIAVSRWLTELLRNEYEQQHVSWVPNSVDLELFNAPPRSKRSQPTVGLLYTRAPRKECSTALKAYQIAKKSVPDLRLLSFGAERPDGDPNWPDDARFEYAPSRSRIPEIYASCDAWLFSSWSEGFGLPLLEAMACRTPVIATPGGAAPDLIGEQVGVLLGEARDPEAMADAILKLSEIPSDLWRKMSEAARRTAQRYTWDDAADRFEFCLKDAIKRTIK